MELPHEEKNLVRDELIELRYLKQRLLIVKILADTGELSDYPVFDEWLSICEQLP
jgi:hypothetical protein